MPPDGVHILALTWPPRAGAWRRAAAQFAVERCLAQPLEAVRVILGPRLDGGATFLAVVVARDTSGDLMA